MTESNARVPVKATHEVKVIRADGTEGETIQRQLSDEEAQELLAWAEREHPELVAEAKANAERDRAKLGAPVPWEQVKSKPHFDPEVDTDRRQNG